MVAFLVLGALRDLGMNAHVLRVEPRPFGNLLLVEPVWGAGLALLVFAASPWLTVLVKDQHPDSISWAASGDGRRRCSTCRYSASRLSSIL